MIVGSILPLLLLFGSGAQLSSFVGIGAIGLMPAPIPAQGLLTALSLTTNLSETK